MDSGSYSTRLDADFDWALFQGGAYFEEGGSIQQTVRSFGQLLDEAKIPYAVAGTLGFFRHGYRRFSEKVEILIARNDVERIETLLSASGYMIGPKPKRVMEIESGVEIRFLISGDCPGKQAKLFIFKDPAECSVRIGNMSVMELPHLIESKIASGSNSNLLDWVDVLETIKRISLPRSFALQLHESVRPKFDELWTAAQTPDPFEH